MAVILNNGVPARITVADFKSSYLAAFPTFTDPKKDPIIESTINTVYAIFSGVNTLWSMAEIHEWYDKATECYKLLTAWYIADMYPRFAVGIQSTGGMPIVEKKIGDLVIKYADQSRLSSTDAVLAMLRSNPFGGKAFMMIMGAPKRWRLIVTPFVG
jgi:hypothetical protein